jgi:hypothetical protein
MNKYTIMGLRISRRKEKIKGDKLKTKKCMDEISKTRAAIYAVLSAYMFRLEPEHGAVS